MENLKAQEHGARIFDNQLLEALTRTSPRITVINYSLLSIALFTGGSFLVGFSVWGMVVLYLCGILFWSLFEYVMHRYLFHLNEHIHSKLADRFQFVIHGVHHQHPRDEERVFMPPVPGLLITAALLGLNYLIMGATAFFFTSGMVTGYMIYAFIHHSVHIKPPHPRFRKLWQHHAMHHYKYPDKAFGVSSPLWDIVFGTMPPKNPPKEEQPHKKAA